MINLQANIDERLWAAIENPYQSGNYSGAVVDAVQFISELIRDRTGLDGDGHELVGKAFGGPNPLLKVNKLQTESERNVQKGIQFLLMGLYQGIRNPRSHGKYADSVEDADSLIVFVSFLLKIIDRARSPFEKAAYLENVFDADFVESDRYAELLVAQIPQNKHWDILIEVYRLKEKANGKKLEYFMRALLSKVSPEEIDQFCAVISDELLATNSIPHRHGDTRRGSANLQLGAHGLDSCRPQHRPTRNGETWRLYSPIRADCIFRFYVIRDQWLRHREGRIRIGIRIEENSAARTIPASPQRIGKGRRCGQACD